MRSNELIEFGSSLLDGCIDLLFFSFELESFLFQNFFHFLVLLLLDLLDSFKHDSLVFLFGLGKVFSIIFVSGYRNVIITSLVVWVGQLRRIGQLATDRLVLVINWSLVLCKIYRVLFGTMLLRAVIILFKLLFFCLLCWHMNRGFLFIYHSLFFIALILLLFLHLSKFCLSFSLFCLHFCQFSFSFQFLLFNLLLSFNLFSLCGFDISFHVFSLGKLGH